MKNETLKAENPDEIVWLRLNRFKSLKLCENLIREKLIIKPNALITDDIIKAKAVGLSSAIESAIGYWQVNAHSLNAKVLSRYYFLLQMTIAEQVSKVNNLDDLKDVQKHTEHGHGLFTVTSLHQDFPDNFYIGALRSGHFYSYCKSLKMDLKEFTFDKRPRKLEDISDQSKICSILDLFRRIPELAPVVEEYIDQPPLCFHIGHADKNHRIKTEAMQKEIKKGNFSFEPPVNEISQTTYVSFYTKSEKVTLDYLAGLDLPFSDFEIEHDMPTKSQYIIAKFIHPSDNHWWHYLKNYSSSYATTTYIVPIWGKNDALFLNFILLYALSIIVRYLPELWYRLNYGDLNHLGSLIDYYISVTDHVLPLKMLERITETHISIHQPGSVFGSI